MYLSVIISTGNYSRYEELWYFGRGSLIENERRHEPLNHSKSYHSIFKILEIRILPTMWGFTNFYIILHLHLRIWYHYRANYIVIKVVLFLSEPLVMFCICFDTSYEELSQVSMVCRGMILKEKGPFKKMVRYSRRSKYTAKQFCSVSSPYEFVAFGRHLHRWARHWISNTHTHPNDLAKVFSLHLEMA